MRTAGDLELGQRRKMLSSALRESACAWDSLAATASVTLEERKDNEERRRREDDMMGTPGMLARKCLQAVVMHLYGFDAVLDTKRVALVNLTMGLTMAMATRL